MTWVLAVFPRDLVRVLLLVYYVRYVTVYPYATSDTEVL
jgi:hypothetical protein